MAMSIGPTLLDDAAYIAARQSGTMVLEGRTYLSTREVARRLSIWTRTVRRAYAKGKLTGLRFGSDIWIDEASLQAYRPVYGRGHWGPHATRDEG